MTRSANEGRGILQRGQQTKLPVSGTKVHVAEAEAWGVWCILGKWGVTEMLLARAGWG